MARRAAAPKKRTAAKPLPKLPPAIEALAQDRGSLLALDVSSKTVGWAVFVDGRLEEFGKWHPTAAKPKEHGAKLASYRKWLHTMLQTYSPNHLIVEAPYAGRNRFAYGTLMMYLGVALTVHHEYFGVEMPSTNRIMPHAVKRGMRAKKGSSYEDRKEKMVELVNILYDLDLQYKADDEGRVSDDDIADAIALAHAWLSRPLADETPIKRKRKPR